MIVETMVRAMRVAWEIKNHCEQSVNKISVIGLFEQIGSLH